MKKLIPFLLLLALPVYAGTQSSGAKNADAVISTGPVIVQSVMIGTDGTNNVTVDLYDSSGASGTKLIPSITVVGSDYYGGVTNLNVQADRGVYLDITTAGTAQVVVYTQR